jgi:hypothetical protein
VARAHELVFAAPQRARFFARLAHQLQPAIGSHARERRLVPIVSRTLEHLAHFGDLERDDAIERIEPRRLLGRIRDELT